MKSTYKLGIAALMASVLTYTGCVNNLTDDVDADASVSAAHVARGTALDVSEVNFDGDTSNYSKSANRYVTVKFNAPVDKSAAQNAIHFYRFSGTTALLSNYSLADYGDIYADMLAAAVADSTYNETELSKGTAIYSDDGKEVTFKLDLSDANALRVYVDPTVIVSTAGAKFNGDGDNIFGESGDDDYSVYRYAASTSSSFDSTVFSAINRENIGSSQFASIYFNSNTVVARVSLDYYDANTNYDSILSSNVKAQYYDVSSKKWTDIALTFALNTTDYTSSNDKYYKYYTATISKTFSTGTQLRLVTANVQNLKTSSAVRGYVRRYDLNNNNSFREINTTTLDENFKIADNLLTVASGVVESIDRGRGYKINSLSIVHNSSYDEATYSTDSNYVDADTDIADVAGLIQGNKYYITYSNNGEVTNLYSFNSISGTAPEVAAKLHFYNVNGDEVKAKVTQSYYDNNNELVVVFDEAITVPESTLYVYADADLAVTYTKTTYTLKSNDGVYDADGTYTDADGNIHYYLSDDVESYEYYYEKAVESAVKFTVGNDTNVKDNTTGTALRKLGTIDLSNL